MRSKDSLNTHMHMYASSRPMKGILSRGLQSKEVLDVCSEIIGSSSRVNLYCVDNMYFTIPLIVQVANYREFADARAAQLGRSFEELLDPSHSETITGAAHCTLQKYSKDPRKLKFNTIRKSKMDFFVCV